MLLSFPLLHLLSGLLGTDIGTTSTGFSSATARHLGLAASNPTIAIAPSGLDGSLKLLQPI